MKILIMYIKMKRSIALMIVEDEKKVNRLRFILECFQISHYVSILFEVFSSLLCEYVR